MTGNIALDVVIGLVFIYLLYSLFVTTLVEFLATILALRARNLKSAIYRMLNDETGEGFAKDFYTQPLIKYLGEKNTAIKKFLHIPNRPSYLQARNFSMAVTRMLHNDGSTGEFNIGTVRKELESGQLKDTQTAKYLLSLLNNSRGKIEVFQKNLETWFDDTMERTTGWYKRKTMFLSLVTGLLISMFFNVDTIQIVKQLSKDPKARAQLVELAGTYSEDSTLFKDTNTREMLNTQLQKLIQHSDTSIQILSISRDPAEALFPFNFFIKKSDTGSISTGSETKANSSGVNNSNMSDQMVSPKDPFGFWFDNLSNFWGCLITTIALSLGAPFWFDLLNKLVQLRSSLGPKQDETGQKTEKVSD